MAAALDAVIVGAGPNGLAAAIVLAESGLSTRVIEAQPLAGGGLRTDELTLPGYRHDLCSAVHPLAVASPLFRRLPLAAHGLQWIDSPAPLAHVLDDSRAVMLERSVDATTAQFDAADGAAYRRLLAPLAGDFARLAPMILAPLRLPSSPWAMARFGLTALRSLEGLARSRFAGAAPRALLAGIAAHAMVPLDSVATASFALVLASAGHAVGWPVARGGSQAIADALVSYYRSLGGELVLGRPIARFEELPEARAILFDLGPRQLAALAGDRLPARYRRRLERFRYGPGVFKADWALDGPIPWKDPRCLGAVTVHLGGDLDAIAGAEAAVNAGELSPRPFVLLGQPSLVDETRAPAGKHTVWAYCHVPHGSPVDALPLVEAQIERHAPGFRDRVLARATHDPRALEAHNPNLVGGDVSGGASDVRQLFFRPMARFDPYATPNPSLFLCSASTPPGAGTHGMCGYWAARSVLRRVFGRTLPAARATS